MAKALLGHLGTGAHPSTLLVENRRLRQRVADLEALVVRLQEQNDQLRLDLTAASLDEALQPA
ncbi:MAG: hypothetical protein ACI379_11875 [Nocardioides sp.]|uniref:hypothetical protein n=1 Tax=Nocardioides sp. TaxID=35761 RepID=UPI003F0B2D7A